MKAKILSGILALAAVFCLTSCINEEKSDVLISFSTSLSYQGSNGAQLVQDMKTLTDEFEAAFNNMGLESMGSNHWVMRDQHSNDRARSVAQSAGDKADASLSAFCPVADFDVTVKISSMFGDENVHTYYYKAK